MNLIGLQKAEKGHAIVSLMEDFPVKDMSYKEYESIKAHMIAAIASDKEIQTIWLIYADGSYGRLGSDIGCLIVKRGGKRTKNVVRLGFNALNNKDEYEAAIYTFKSDKLGVKHINQLQFQNC